ncbi:MAG TPA: hypothetical protein VFG72_04500 [Marmoricola sp.]|nr:hypothetical protein [Marmoricola sp.]
MRPTRWSALAGVLAIAALVPTHAVAAPKPDSPRPTAVARVKTTSATFSIATYNIRNALSADVAVADIEKLAAAGADVIATQEMGSRMRRDAVRAAMVDCEGCAFDAHMTNPSEVGATPILFRTDRFDLEETGSRLAADRTFVGRKGAGPATIAAKYVNYVKLREKTTGRYLYVLNSHAVASVQGPDGRSNGNARRMAMYRQHMETLKSMVSEFTSRGVSVFVVGDLNVNYRRDVRVQDPAFPYANLSQVRVETSYASLGLPQIGTHEAGTRLIDYISYLQRRTLKPLSQEILFGYASDHRPVLVEFRLAGFRRR